MRFSDMKQREVINCKDCKRLGFVSDVIFDSCTGKVEALVVPGPGKILGCFCPATEYIIKFCHIIRIGPDIILVDIDLVESLEKKKEH
ncbi:MAG: YlmC/YmxH family sporulation protein [Lachnospiraceae bacterium]|nr:YlmC/YmxH family sporulation protein [Lachnospiraceae bacterium]